MDQKAMLEGEVSKHHDYYNMIPGKTPPAGGIEDLRITREENKQDANMQGVKVQHRVEMGNSLTKNVPKKLCFQSFQPNLMAFLSRLSCSVISYSFRNK